MICTPSKFNKSIKKPLLSSKEKPCYYDRRIKNSYGGTCVTKFNNKLKRIQIRIYGR